MIDLGILSRPREVEIGGIWGIERGAPHFLIY